MHELSVAQSLVELVSEQLAQLSVEPDERVGTIFVSVGKLSGIVPAALSSAFAVAAKESAVSGAVLEIEEIHPRLWCTQCLAERDVRSVQSICCDECGQPGNVNAG